LHPQPQVQRFVGKDPKIFNSTPSAWRSGNVLFLLVNPFGDNQPGHTGAAQFSSRSHLTENGKKLPLFGLPPFQVAKLNAGPGTVVYSLTAKLTGSPTALSSRTTTTWTFRTSRDPSARLPRAWICENGRFETVRKCSIPSMISLNYTVANLGLTGVAPAGAQAIDLALGHFQPSAHPAAITKVTAQVSYDSGKSWQPVNVAPTAAGHYRLTFTPPPGVDVTTRVTATDAAGASVDETILNGYHVGSQA
jgi:hypothetical protein